MALGDGAMEVVGTVLEAARRGDMQACALVMARIIPPLKSVDAAVRFTYDPTGSAVQQAEQILKAAGDGFITPETASTLVDALAKVSALKTAESLEQRITALEARNETLA